MKTIYKYTLTNIERQRIDMPFGAEVVSVKSQNNQITLWALVETDNTMIGVVFRVVGNGFDMSPWFIFEEKLKFLGTVLTFNDAVAWHIFQEL